MSLSFNKVTFQLSMRIIDNIKQTNKQINKTKQKQKQTWRKKTQSIVHKCLGIFRYFRVNSCCISYLVGLGDVAVGSYELVLSISIGKQNINIVYSYNVGLRRRRRRRRRRKNEIKFIHLMLRDPFIFFLIFST